jgi:periplasmic copper chaperone A
MKANVLAAGVLAAMIAAGSAFAGQEHFAITGAWTRPAQAGGNGAGYFSITNKGPEADRITGARCRDANSVGLHEMTMDGMVMRMRPLKGLDLPVGKTQTLSPGGMHLMLIGLKAPLRLGERSPCTLFLQHGGKVPIWLQVRRG